MAAATQVAANTARAACRPGQDVGIDEDDIGHGQERRDPGQNLDAHVGIVLAQL
jgi:hypothetical protein